MRAIAVLVLACSFAAAEQSFSDFTVPLPIPEGDTLIVGVVGGWVDWDEPQRAVRRTALELRSMPGVWVETVENHRIALAQELILRAFDRDRNGWLGEQERSQIRLTLYGHSLGGRAALRLCRWLHERGIPVQLAVIVDAFGRDSYTVPPNVAQVANLYQRDAWMVRGARAVHPEDPQRTKLVGNWEFRYRGRDVVMPGEDVFSRWFFGSHLKMEYDPEPWARVKELVASVVRSGDVLSLYRER